MNKNIYVRRFHCSRNHLRDEKIKREIRFLLAIIFIAASLGATQKIFKIGAGIHPKTQSQPITLKILPVSLDKIKVIELKSNQPEIEVQVRREAERACADHKLGDYCVEDLLGIFNNETYFQLKVFKDGVCIPEGYSDGGKAMGCYQIHQEYHPDVTRAQAENLTFATDWTLNRLISKGYPKYRSYSLMAHNGTPGTRLTLAYLKNINKFVKQ